MQAVAVAIIAVLGTLGGGLVSGLLQQRNASRSEASAQSERLRQERLDAFIAFAQSLSNLRRVAATRLITRNERGRESDEYGEAKAEVYEARVTARGALVRVQLLTESDDVIRLAKEALAAAIDIEGAVSEDELPDRTEHSREAADAFVAAASKHGGIRV